MNATQHKIFESYFQAQVEKAGAGTPSEMLHVLDRMEKDAREKGIVPISARETISVPVHSPQVQAILAGKEISLGGVELNAPQTLESRLASNSPKQSLMLVGLIVLVGLAFASAMFFLAFSPRKTAEATPTETAAATLTTTPSRTPPPTAGAATATPYALVMATAKVPTGVNDPVSVEFGGVTFVLYVSSLQGGEWQPAVAEWLEGTELRRVLAVPYSQEVGNAVVGMQFGDPIRLRLNSGEVVLYRIVEIARIKRHQIEILADARPGIAILLYGERSADRYVLIGEAVQPGSEATRTPTPTTTPTESVLEASAATPTITATLDLSATVILEPDLTTTVTIPPTVTLVASVTQTPTITPTWTQTLEASVTLASSVTPTTTPTATRTPTVTITPAFAFTPPPLVSVVVTEAQSITNDLAGLRLDVSNCTRVAQIGAREGRFLLCDVTLSAIRPGAEYSGQALAITEYAQVARSADWWPPALTIVGGIGDGSLAGVGSAITGKVAGEVKKSQSEPVLLWEQAGIRFVIYLETE